MEDFESIYAKLSAKRNTYLKRARDNAKLSLPYLIPDVDDPDEAIDYANPYSSLAASGIHNLASKLVASLFPTNISFFKLILDPKGREELNARNSLSGNQVDIENELASIERKINNFIDTTAIRPILHASFLHLLVAGNVLLYFKKDKRSGKEKLIQYDLNNYVVKRDKVGNVITVICREGVNPRTLPQEVVDGCGLETSKDSYALYTGIDLISDDKYVFYQEINKIHVPGTHKEINVSDSPFIPLTYIRSNADRSYGRSMMDTIVSDVTMYESLSKSNMQSAAVNSTMIWGVDPAGQVDIDELKNAKSGDFINMMPNSVYPIQMVSSASLQTNEYHMKRLETALNRFLLIYSENYENKEMTATEVRWIAGELERSLGGIYANFQYSLQLPLLEMILKILKAQNAFPSLTDKDLLNIKIIAGHSGIGANRELQDLTGLAQFLGNLGDGLLQKYINIDVIVDRVVNAFNIDPEGLMKTKAEIKADEDQMRKDLEDQRTYELLQKAAGPTVSGAIKTEEQANE